MLVQVAFCTGLGNQLVSALNPGYCLLLALENRCWEIIALGLEVASGAHLPLVALQFLHAQGLHHCPGHWNPFQCSAIVSMRSFLMFCLNSPGAA